MTKYPAHAFRLAGDVSAEESEDDKPKRFSGLANSGKPFQHGWLGTSILDMDSMKVGKQHLSVLRDHDSAQIAGRTTKIEPGTDGLAVEGELYTMTDAGREAIALLDAGHPMQMSAYVPPRRVQMVDESQEVEVNGQKLSGPLAVWRDIDLREVTLTAVGADEQTHAAAALSAGETLSVEVITTSDKGDEMTKPQTSDAPTMTAARLQSEHADVYSEVSELGANAERQRVGWITKQIATVGAELCQKAIDEGWDKGKCADEFLASVSKTKGDRLNAIREEAAGEDSKLSRLRGGDADGAHDESDYADPSKLKSKKNKEEELAAVEDMPLGEARYKREWELSAKDDPDWEGLTESDYVWARNAEAKEGI